MNCPIWCRVVLLALAFVVPLSGCLPVPVPALGHSITSRDNLPDRVPGFIVKGKTTRGDVLLSLGTPDAHSPDGRWFAYRSERHTGGVVFVLAAGGSAGAFGAAGYEERLLTVRFDEHAVVVDATLEERICPRGVVAMGNVGSEGSSCLKVPDLSAGPSQELASLATIYVAKAATDERNIDRLIVAELRDKGLQATTGPANAAPRNVDAIVTYQDGWTTEATARLEQLNVLIVAPRSSQVLGKASSRQAPPEWKTPEHMVAEVVAAIFEGPGKPFLTLPPYRPTPARPMPTTLDQAAVRIEPVADARMAPRGTFVGEREALGIALGKIDMAPRPVEVIRQLLRAELALLGHPSVAEGAEFVVDAQLTKFEVRTPSTLTYWDVNGVIAVDVGLKRGEGPRQSLNYEARCTERTYVSLSEPLIKRVIVKCLDSLGASVREDPALARLLVGQ